MVGLRDICLHTLYLDKLYLKYLSGCDILRKWLDCYVIGRKLLDCFKHMKRIKITIPEISSNTHGILSGCPQKWMNPQGYFEQRIIYIY
jgi:hypothetical protein